MTRAPSGARTWAGPGSDWCTTAVRLRGGPLEDDMLVVAAAIVLVLAWEAMVEVRR